MTATKATESVIHIVLDDDHDDDERKDDAYLHVALLERSEAGGLPTRAPEGFDRSHLG